MESLTVPDQQTQLDRLIEEQAELYYCVHQNTAWKKNMLTFLSTVTVTVIVLNSLSKKIRSVFNNVNSSSRIGIKQTFAT